MLTDVSSTELSWALAAALWGMVSQGDVREFVTLTVEAKPRTGNRSEALYQRSNHDDLLDGRPPAASPPNTAKHRP